MCGLMTDWGLCFLPNIPVSVACLNLHFQIQPPCLRKADGSTSDIRRPYFLKQQYAQISMTDLGVIYN